jgi:L-alanine-DL-glutamate epimerase-like enolase superfamily enzyme
VNSPQAVTFATVTSVRTRAFTVPTQTPESDGTLEWDRTTLVLVEVTAGDVTGLGYSYADVPTAQFIDTHLKKVVEGTRPTDVPATWRTMVHEIRNMGRAGVASMAISAVDTALWDLKAKLLHLPLVSVFGAVHEEVEAYGSGGFTSQPVDTLKKQLGGWAASGFKHVKMKIGRHPKDDVSRVRAAREAIGPETELFVDANGAYTRQQALEFAEAFKPLNVRYFEEPVSSDDLEGLRWLRDRFPEGMDVAAGEYGYDSFYFRRMLEAGAVDILQADATRCAGFTGFLEAATLAQSHGLALSAHCAPALHLHVACAVPNFCHLEYFFDHARIEEMFFEGAAHPRNGMLKPDLARPGMGLSLKESEAARYAVYGNN